MSQKILTLAALCCAALLLGGCDFFRTLAGRPTSADIEAARLRIEREEAAHRARLDSLRRVQKAMADSLELLDAIKAEKSNLLSAGSMGGVSASALESRYYIVVGAFSLRENAEKQGKKAADKGYRVNLVPFRNGFTAVCLEGSRNLADAYDALRRIKEEPFCPPDAWVLVNE
ncbi:MAG: SPOR domain-containing protein [Bacteroidales bacterium]|nr:SPOR domain-containing protein [Bacteroidales bacterium]